MKSNTTLQTKHLIASAVIAVLALGATGAFAALAQADTNTAIATSTAGSSTVSGTVFNDANANKVQDNGESGLANLLVWLHLGTHKNSTVVATTTTDSLGHYIFSNISAGTYFVQQQVMAGFHIFGHNKKVTVGAGASTTINFADVATSSISHKGGNDGDKDNIRIASSTIAMQRGKGEGKGRLEIHLPNISANIHAFLGGDNSKGDNDQDDN